jgi:hypothetical protein
MTLLPGFEPDTTEVRTWTLELLDPACLRPASRPAVAAILMRAGRAAPELGSLLRPVRRRAMALGRPSRLE